MVQTSRRRRFLRASAAVAAGMAGCTAFGGRHDGTPSATDGPSTTDDAAWSQFRHDARNSGYVDEGVDGLGGEGGPTTDGYAATGPVVADDTVYVATTTGALHALDGDGERWRRTLDAPARAGAALSRDAILSGTTAGTLVAFAPDGTRRARLAGLPPVTTPLAVVGDVAYGGSEEGQVFAAAPTEQEHRWTATLGDAVRGVAVAGGMVVAVTRGTVHGLAAADGAGRWTFEAATPPLSPPAVADGTVHVGDGAGTVHALAADDGERRWRTSVAAADSVLGTTAPAVGGGAVAAVAHRFADDDDPNPVAVLSAADGQRRWRTRLPVTDDSAPVLTGDRLLVETADAVHAYDVATGEQVDSAAPFGQQYSLVGVGPAVAGGSTYVLRHHFEAEQSRLYVL